MNRWWLVVLVAAGCAQPQSNNTSTGGTRADFAGVVVDLGGVDLAMSEPDLAGVDLAGADLRRPAGDLADVCDYVKQTGCNAFEKCTYTNIGNLCLSNGTVAVAGLCGSSSTPPTSGDECKAGLACISVGSMGGPTTAFCHEYCAVDGDCAQPIFAGGLAPKCESSTSLPFKLCTISCAPFGAADGTNGCPTGTACRYGWDQTAMTEETDCEPFGALGNDADCKNGICAPGFVCVGPDQNNLKCRKVCRNGMAADCPAGGYLCQTPYNGASYSICIN